MIDRFELWGAAPSDFWLLTSGLAVGLTIGLTVGLLFGADLAIRILRPRLELCRDALAARDIRSKDGRSSNDPMRRRRA